MPLALARLVSFAGCVLRPCGGAALRFSPRLGGRSGACSLPPKRLLGSPPLCARGFPSPRSLRSRLRSLRSLGALVAPVGAGLGVPPRLPLGSPLPHPAPRPLGCRFSARSARACASPRLVALPAVGLSSSALLAPAGAPRCALPALALARLVLAPFGCALPPRVGVPCLPAVGIPDACLECKGGFAMLGGSSSGAYPSPPSGARVYDCLLWYLLGLPPQTLTFEVVRWRARIKWC